MNKKASGAMILYGMMIGLMVWIAFTQMLGPIKDGIEDARAVQQLDCSNSSISIGTKATCVMVDWTLFGYAGAVIAAIIGAVGGGVLNVYLKNKQQ